MTYSRNWTRSTFGATFQKSRPYVTFTWPPFGLPESLVHAQSPHSASHSLTRSTIAWKGQERERKKSHFVSRTPQQSADRALTVMEPGTEARGADWADWDGQENRQKCDRLVKLAVLSIKRGSRMATKKSKKTKVCLQVW